MGVGLAGTAQHVATLDHVGACSAAAATAATTTAPTTGSIATTATVAAVAGPAPAAGGAGDNLAARHVHGHGAAAGHCLGGGRRADLGGRACSLIVAGACCLRVQWRLGVGIGARTAEKEAKGGESGARARQLRDMKEEAPTGVAGSRKPQPECWTRQA